MAKSPRNDELGLNSNITRRDFINFSAAAVLGTALAGCNGQDKMPGMEMPPDWYGYGGVGDYAGSHGNTPEIMKVAHAVRDGFYDPVPATAVDTGEVFDMIIVGGGFSGLSSAFHFNRLMPNGRCLIIDNHPIFGGEAKRNEFMVNGYRIMGPQGSNATGISRPTGEPDDYFTALGMPREFEYPPVPESAAHIKFSTDNYGFMHWLTHQSTVGHFFDGPGTGKNGKWVIDIWDTDLSNTPWPESLRKEFLRWRKELVSSYKKDDVDKWLDSMTLKDYYEKVLGLPTEITAYADPLLAGAIGLGCDGISAYWGKYFSLPGFSERRLGSGSWHTFPGGNAGIARHFIKKLIPNGIKGDQVLTDIISNPVAFDELDKNGNPVRIRLSATVIGVEHAGGRSDSEQVVVTYVKDNRVHKVRAKTVTMASGGWMNRRVIKDLPSEFREAYATFRHSSVLVANVALNNWRFLQKLGVAGCMYSGGIGFSCNIRRPMIAGKYQEPFNPDLPIVLTFYIPLFYPGRPAIEQGYAGRQELLTTPFRQYERQIREQMVRLFGSAGFDPVNDIAGLVLNRWGHAYTNPGPGFMYSLSGGETPRDIIRKGYGRIAFGHSEFKGHQSWTGAASEGRRAVEELVDKFF